MYAELLSTSTKLQLKLSSAILNAMYEPGPTLCMIWIICGSVVLHCLYAKLGPLALQLPCRGFFKFKFL
jgi:hypothetical protein